MSRTPRIPATTLAAVATAAACLLSFAAAHAADAYPSIVKIIAEPETARKFAGGVPSSSAPEDLAKVIRDEFDRLGKVVKAANSTAD